MIVKRVNLSIEHSIARNIWTGLVMFSFQQMTFMKRLLGNILQESFQLKQSHEKIIIRQPDI